MACRIALIGDFSPDVVAHRAIPRALELACAAAGTDVTWRWIATRDLRAPARDLQPFEAVWAVPGSPYENAAGMFDAIRFARESGRPFLGTCGGFQHALIEFARNVAGISEADHAESNASATTLIITPLSCSMVEKTASVRFVEGSRLREIYDADGAQEGYHCNYGCNPDHRSALETAGLRFTAFDDAGEIRGAELPRSSHPFFVGTLFQPERRALCGTVPSLVRAFVTAAATRERDPTIR